MAQASTTGSDDLKAAFAAAEAWWRLAGIDNTFVDQPRDWLAVERASAEPQPQTPGQKRGTASAAPAPEPAKLGGDRARWPETLAAFADWWLAEPTLGFAPGERRVAPRGSQGAELMVLVPQPEDTDHETLLGGAQGRLLAAILAALGLSEPRIYLASVLPAHLGLVDWGMLAEQGLGDVLGHHVALVAPRRLLVLGRESILPLVKHGSTQVTGKVPQFHHEVWKIPVIHAPSLDALLERPTRKAGVWQTLLDGMNS